jgi:hypothetical protein
LSETPQSSQKINNKKNDNGSLQLADHYEKKIHFHFEKSQIRIGRKKGEKRKREKKRHFRLLKKNNLLAVKIE